MNEAEIEQFFYQLFKEVADVLSGRNTLVRFRTPFLAPSLGLFYRKGDIAYIDVTPVEDVETVMRIFLHECAHAKLHFGKMKEWPHIDLPAGRDRTKFICKKCRGVIGSVFVKNKVHHLELAFAQGVIIKGEVEIACPTCGAVRDWRMGEEAINHLVNRILRHRAERKDRP
jgi:hypothetical protein